MRNSYMTRQELQEGIERLFGTLYFDKLTYQFVKDGNGFILNMIAKEKPPSSFRTSVHYDNFYGAGMVINYTQSNFLISGTRLTAAIDISEYPQARLYYRKYAGPRMNILAGFESCLESNLIPGYLDGDEVGYLRQNHFTTELSIKNSFDLNHSAGIGLLFEYSAVYPNKSMQTLYPEAFNFKRYGFAGFGLAASYGMNTLDDLLYPFEGTQVEIYLKGIYNPMLDLKYLSDTVASDASLQSFSKLYVNVDHYGPLGPKLNYNVGFSLGLSTDDYIASDYFFVGGNKNNLRRNHIPFVGYSLGEIIGPDFIRLKLGMNYRLYKNLQLEILGNGMLSSDSFQEMTDALVEFSKESFHVGYGGGFTYNTPLGPLNVFLAGNNKDSRLTWYINFGFTF